MVHAHAATTPTGSPALCGPIPVPAALTAPSATGRPRSLCQVAAEEGVEAEGVVVVSYFSLPTLHLGAGAVVEAAGAAAGATCCLPQFVLLDSRHEWNCTHKSSAAMPWSNTAPNDRRVNRIAQTNERVRLLLISRFTHNRLHS